MFVVRHAERADTAAGTAPTMAADPELSDAGRARAESLAAALMPLLRDGPQREAALGGLARVRRKLAGPPDGQTAAERVTALAAELIEPR